MEKEEIKWEQEQDETSPLVRKPGYVKIEAEVSNGVSEKNGHFNGAHQMEEIEYEEEQKEENLVFYDEPEGMWKCRICTWTYQIGSVCVDHIQNHKGQMHMLMHFKALNFDLEGIESVPGERQILKQTTHDLFCPNCNSCITKRVNLGKRKRISRLDDEIKPSKKEAIDASKLGISSVQPPSDSVRPTEGITEIGSGLDIFICLSCFSIFIPIENKFKVLYGGEKGPENIQDEHAPNIENDTTNTKLVSNKQETVDNGSSTPADLGTKDVPSGPGDMNGRPTTVPIPLGYQDVKGQVHPSKVPQNIITQVKLEIFSSEPLKVENISCSSQGKDAVITIDSQPAESSGIVESTSNLPDNASYSQPLLVGRETNEERIGVVKSIVYGGLVESITSLSVVSSAAGGGATTLNVLAMALANLVGGLFIICHNLWELKSESVVEPGYQVSDGTVEQRDRYKELLGRRQNFTFHAMLAITSYLIFGLVPPIVYGFSFSETGDKQLNILLVSAVSLVCIVALAIGKAYTLRPPKPYQKTVVTFVMLWFMVGGVSYAAGELVERLLEKFGVFEAGSVSNLVVPTRVSHAW